MGGKGFTSIDDITGKEQRLGPEQGPTFNQPPHSPTLLGPERPHQDQCGGHCGAEQSGKDKVVI